MSYNSKKSQAIRTSFVLSLISIIIMSSYCLGLRVHYVQADASGIPPSVKNNISKALTVAPSTITSLSSSTAKKVASVNVSNFKGPQFKTTGTEKEQILSTRAGVNNVRAYQLAKIGPSISNTVREQAVFDISADLQTDQIVGKNQTQNTSAFKASQSTTNSTSSSNNIDTAKSQRFLRVNAEPRDPLNITTGCGGQCTPPDIQVAAGPNQVIQMVNIAGKIWSNDNDNNIVKYFALGDFFATGTDVISDPYVVFDSTDQRWFASIFDVTSESYHIAVSNTDDATGGWNVFDLPFVSCPDQGRFAVSQDLFVISVNDYNKGCVDGFVGTQHAIISKHDLISGANNVRVQITAPDISQFSMLPVQPLSSNPTMFMASVEDMGTTAAKIVEISGLPPNATLSSFSVPILQTQTPAQAVQPDGSKLDTGDGRISTAAYRNGHIWIGFNDRCYNEHSCIRLVDIDVDNGVALQDFNIASKKADIYYPSLSIDNSENMIVAFSVSSSSLYPSVMATGQTPNYDINTVAHPVYLVKGSASDTSTRYGDYTGASFDPQSNVWISSEYNKSPTGWSTHIASLSHIPGK